MEQTHIASDFWGYTQRGIFLLFFAVGLSKHKFFVCEGQLMKILGFIFSGDQEKKSCRIFDTGILRVKHRRT